MGGEFINHATIGVWYKPATVVIRQYSSAKSVGPQTQFEEYVVQECLGLRREFWPAQLQLSMPQSVARSDNLSLRNGVEAGDNEYLQAQRYEQPFEAGC